VRGEKRERRGGGRRGEVGFLNRASTNEELWRSPQTLARNLRSLAAPIGEGRKEREERGARDLRGRGCRGSSSTRGAGMSGVCASFSREEGGQLEKKGLIGGPYQSEREGKGKLWGLLGRFCWVAAGLVLSGSA
jgi:hypothetical protein